MAVASEPCLVGGVVGLAAAGGDTAGDDLAETVLAEAALGLDLVLLEARALLRTSEHATCRINNAVWTTYPADGQVVGGDSCGERGRGDDGLGKHLDFGVVVVETSDLW